MTLASRFVERLGRDVSCVGLGAGPLGDPALFDQDAIRLLRAALDLGVTLFDTAPSYGQSEERIGRAFAGSAAREQIVLVTKGGYGVDGVPDWTPEVVVRGVEQALTRLRTDRIDVFLLHSCPYERLARGDLLDALLRTKAAGKVRAVGYSGDGPALDWAAACSAVDVVECSVNVVDRSALVQAVPAAVARRGVVLGKRALASAAWSPGGGREGHDGVYARRFRAAFGDFVDGERSEAMLELAVRFAAFAPGVTSALVGTRSIDHVRAIVAAAARGPLDPATQRELETRFSSHGGTWSGVI